MCALKIEDQGTITLSQMDYLPILIESFLIDRRAQGLSGETVKFYKKKLKYFHSTVHHMWLLYLTDKRALR